MRPGLCAYAIGLLLTGNVLAQAEDFPQTIRGDLGVGAYYTRSVIRSKRDEVAVLPYADLEYGRLFARVDTLGIKTLPLGYGYLELVGRISLDGFRTDTPELHGLENRETSVPLGIGTLQVTPLGGFMFNAFHDVRRSKGQWLEAIYGGELDLPGVTLYPLLGAEYQSSAYVRYYYGISAQEASASQYAAYDPAGSFNSLLGVIGDVALGGPYHLNFQVRRKWLGDAIRQSPIVDRRYLDTAYLSLSYRFR
jgi:MipA family protein